MEQCLALSNVIAAGGSLSCSWKTSSVRVHQWRLLVMREKSAAFAKGKGMRGLQQRLQEN
jgi:hypothetical protein